MKTNTKKNKINALKKLENGQIFVQWKKGGKFVLVEGELAVYVVWASLQ